MAIKRTPRHPRPLKYLVKKDLLLGLPNKDIIEKLRTGAYETKDKLQMRRAKNYICLIRKEIAKDWQAQEKELKEMMLTRLLNLYATSLDAQDRANALNSLKEINKVTGLYSTQKMDVNLTGDLNIDFGFDNENKDDTNEE